MLTCDLFELSLTLKQNASGHPVIEFSYYTDLPAGTRVILSCERTYNDMQDEECVWVGYNAVIFVEPAFYGDFNGGSGQIDVVESDQKALALFNEINSSFSSGVKTPVSDDIRVDLTVGARQRLRAFGKNNCELSGQMVECSGGVNVVRVSESLTIPMLPELQPIDP
mgnify:FL=1|tara:strand:- start:104 stop:604 length:501 start_codon:yes stop_codon:yes gene_type:complete